MSASKRTPENAKRILDGLCEAKSVQAICASHPDMPHHRIIYKWARDDPEFREMCRLAREEQAHFLFQQLLEIADDDSRDRKPAYDEEGKMVSFVMDKRNLVRTRIMIDARKFTIAKLLPHVYGDLSRVELTGKGGEPLRALTSEQLDEQIAVRMGISVVELKAMDDKEIGKSIH